MIEKPIAISVFSGIGGLDIGFAAAGFDIIAQVELDQFCQRVLRRHKGTWWANSTIFDDATTFGIASLPGIKHGDIDAMFGGFPCQPHSDAGKKLGAKDDRDLWPEFRRIIGEFRPRTILLENVPGILTGYAVNIIADLATLGYDCRWGTIQAADTGTPHKRERWFCMAYDHRQRQLQPEGHVTRFSRRATHKRKTMGNTKSTRLSKRGNRPSKNTRSDYQSKTRRINNRLAGTGYASGNGGIRKRATESRMGRAVDGVPSWLDRPRWAAGQGSYQHELEAPRTIGKGIDPHRASKIKALGNAVVPQIAFALACQIRKLL